MPFPKQEEILIDPRTSTGKIRGNSYPGQRRLLPLIAGDLFSEVISGGSPLVNWLNTVKKKSWQWQSSFLAWVSGKDFDGSQTYLEYQTADGTILEDPDWCDFGDGGLDYATYTWANSLKRMSTSNKNRPLHYFDFQNLGRLTQWENEPLWTIRGPNAGQQVGQAQGSHDFSEADWGVASTAQAFEQHINWNTIWGDSTIPSNNGFSDGLLTVLTPGYVQSRMVGTAGNPAPVYADPLYRSSGIETAHQLLAALRTDLRRIRSRARGWQYELTEDDIAIVMPSGFWDLLKAIISQQRMVDHIIGKPVGIDEERFDIDTTNMEYTHTFNMISQGGVGFGYFPLDGLNVPVIIEDGLGINAETDEGKPGIISDVLILVRNFRGQSVTHHVHLDFNDFVEPPTSTATGFTGNIMNQTIFQGGLIRSSWININNLCFYIGLETYLQVECRLPGLQARYTNVHLEVLPEYSIESASWTHPNFYAYRDQVGGMGQTLLEPNMLQ